MMSKYDPKFWEVTVEPQILEALLIAPDFLETILGDEADQTISEEKARLKQEAIVQIAQLIQTQLTAKQRQVVELYFYENKTQAQIAQILGINQQVVSKHLFGAVRDGRKVGGAIKKLRKLCEKLGIDPKKWV